MYRVVFHLLVPLVGLMCVLRLQQVPQGLAPLESEEVVEPRRRWRRRGSVAVQHAVVVLDAPGPQDVAQVQGQGQELQVLEEAQVREADQGEDVLAVVVVVEQGQEGLEEVQGQGQEVQVLEEEQVLPRPVGGLLGCDSR